MASLSSSIRFIDAALSSKTSYFSLSYTDPNQKWLIRDHLIALLQDYPNFTVSNETFVHNNGNIVDLLKASGYLHLHQYVSTSEPAPIHLTIWIHENYPYTPPMAFIFSPNQILHHNHPFVDSSCGGITSPYIQTWFYPGCNLCDLVRNLVQIFSLDHPFFFSFDQDHTSSSNTHPSLVSKREALDRLLGTVHYDMAALYSETGSEIEELSVLQEELKKRNDSATCMVIRQENERRRLKERVMKLTEESDMLTNWLKFNDPRSAADDDHEVAGDAFEAVDEISEAVIDGLAADTALEDVMYVLQKALEQGVVSINAYIKQVRGLAREQFFHRALLVRLKGSGILI